MSISESLNSPSTARSRRHPRLRRVPSYGYSYWGGERVWGPNPHTRPRPPSVTDSNPLPALAPSNETVHNSPDHTGSGSQAAHHQSNAAAKSTCGVLSSLAHSVPSGETHDATQVSAPPVTSFSATVKPDAQKTIPNLDDTVFVSLTYRGDPSHGTPYDTVHGTRQPPSAMLWVHGTEGALKRLEDPSKLDTAQMINDMDQCRDMQHIYLESDEPGEAWDRWTNLVEGTFENKLRGYKGTKNDSNLTMERVYASQVTELKKSGVRTLDRVKLRHIGCIGQDPYTLGLEEKASASTSTYTQ